LLQSLRTPSFVKFDNEDAVAEPTLTGITSHDWVQVLLQESRLGSDAMISDEAFNATNATNSTAAAVTGVQLNKAGDLVIFLSALGTNIGIVIVSFLLLAILRRVLPRVFSSRRTGEGPKQTEPSPASGGIFGWVSLSWRPTDEVEEAAGLDHAMYLQFLDLGSRLCLLIGLPCVLVLCPLHFFVGGGAAGEDRLSSIGMGNVQHGSWLCWLHAFFVWYVVLVIHAQVHRAQKSFLPLRVRWLKEMPTPAVTSVLLQNIPEHLKTGEELRVFFDEGVFGYKAVKRVDFVKDTRELLRWKRHALESASNGAAFRTGNGKVLQGEELQAVAESMAEKLRKEAVRSDDHNLAAAFVTFTRRREAALAYRLLSEEDNDGIRADLPPEPSEVLWQDLAISPEKQAAKELVGYFLIFLIFWGFMPVVVLIQSIANLSTLEQDVPFFQYLITQLPVLATLWNGLMASFALTLAMSFLPSLLLLIFTNFFVSKAEVDRQHRLQVWYHYFLVIFVLLVTAIGSSIFVTGKYLVEHPFEAPSLLASNMPKSTHFYLSFIAMQMSSYATSGLRMAQLTKYLAFKLCYEADKAKEKSEPEDDSFYGMGSRSARATLELVTVITFCQLSPLISLLGVLMFTVSRVVHSFLFLEAEDRKPDLGGAFWVTSLRQVQQGLFLFVLLMTGVLAERAGTWVPSAISASSAMACRGAGELSFGRQVATLGGLVFVYWSFVTFRRRYRWQHLQVEEVLQESELQKTRASSCDHYMQPELPGDLPPKPQGLLEAVAAMRTKLRVF
ncbi:unnamed protein product, partial [Effrenium voratum]